jgi:hypothetical protein
VVRETVVVIAAMVVALTQRASAESTKSAVSIGLDVRSDAGTHVARVPLGIRLDSWKASVVIDPIYALDGQHDFDAIAEYFFDRFGVLVGWRWSQVDLADSHHHQQRSLVGATAVGPQFLSGRIQTSASFELATLWVKHGGDTPTQWLPSDRSLLDHFAFGLFVRIEYAVAL